MRKYAIQLLVSASICIFFTLILFILYLLLPLLSSLIKYSLFICIILSSFLAFHAIWRITRKGHSIKNLFELMKVGNKLIVHLELVEKEIACGQSGSHVKACLKTFSSLKETKNVKRCFKCEEIYNNMRERK